MQLSFKNNVRISLTLIFAVIVFHLCILLKWIPYDIAWGGKLNNDKEMYQFESVSIVVNIFIMWILAMKADMVKFKFPHKVIQVILWIFCLLFVLNTIGNLLAKTNFEKVFALFTSVLAVLFFLIIRNKKPTS